MFKKMSFFTSLFFILFVLYLNVDAAIISFDPLEDPIIVAPNESFQIDIYAQEDASLGDLTSYGFYVDTLGSPSLVVFDGYTISNPDYDDFGAGNFVDGFKNSLDPNAGDNILMATLFFTAGEVPGMDTIMVEGLVEDLNGLAYEFGDSDISASISTIVVPIPSAVLLLSSGIFGVTVLRKKFHYFFG
jgi:hypothetical protein